VWFSYAVFFATLVEEFQWGRGGTAVPFSVGSLVQAALSPLIGLLTDRTLAFVFSLVALCGVVGGFWLATRRLISATRALPSR
jgi:hypothetical protein